jgi:hypothetical protein
MAVPKVAPKVVPTADPMAAL